VTSGRQGTDRGIPDCAPAAARSGSPRESKKGASLSESTNSSIVSATDLERVFGEGAAAVRALDGITVDFPKGRLTAIMGPSGSGKSTLMHCLAGLDRPTSGTVSIDGVELGALDDAKLTELRRDKVGFVFQFFNLLPVLDARENMLLPLRLAGRRADQARFDRLVAEIGLSDRLDHRPAELSGGQQQRVAIARALLGEPAVVFADEPTGNLDSTSSEEVLALLRRAVDELDQTVVMVTHDPIAAAIADRVLVLVDGRIVRDEPAGDADQVVELMKEAG
jgi:putative ABC transport system ATP-binding protein